MHRTECPICRRPLHYRDEHVGKKAKCRKCAASFLLPELNGEDDGARSAERYLSPVQSEQLDPGQSTASVSGSILVDKLRASEQRFGLATKVLAGVVAWAVIFSILSTLLIQRPVHQTEGNLGMTIVFGTIGWAIWGGLTLAILEKRRWAIGLAFVFSALGLVLGIPTVFSGPSLVTPEWPTYLALANGLATLFLATWALAMKDALSKVQQEYDYAQQKRKYRTRLNSK